MAQANVEKKPDGTWEVSATFGNLPAAMRAVDELVRIGDESFAPPPVSHLELSATDGHTTNGSGIIPESIAKTMIRDHVFPDDDYGAPGEPPRCKTGACD